jgi:hypothetical protein
MVTDLKKDELTDEEKFDDAFKEATGEEPKDEAKVDNEDDKVDEDESEGKAKGDEGDKKEVKEPDVEQLKKEAEENKRLFEEEKQRRKSLEGMYNSDQETKKKLSEELESLKKTKAPDKTQDEADPELDEYMKEYDYITKNEAKLRDREWQKRKDELLSNISELLKVPLSKVERAVEGFEADQTVKHKTAVQEAHPDFGTVFKRDDVLTWVETLPSGVKKAYTEIADGGSTEDVIFLLSEYKRVQGIETPTEDSADEVIDIDPQKKERLKKMEAVITKKKAVSSSSGKAEDFDGAWAEATK